MCIVFSINKEFLNYFKNKYLNIYYFKKPFDRNIMNNWNQFLHDFDTPNPNVE